MTRHVYRTLADVWDRERRVVRQPDGEGPLRSGAGDAEDREDQSALHFGLPAYNQPQLTNPASLLRRLL
jgi:hypothetical protein